MVDFIARELALQTMELWDVKPVLALAVHRRALVQRVGLLTSRGWAQHIVDRWRDAFSTRPAAPQAADIDLAADVFFSNNPSRGGCCSMNARYLGIWRFLFDLVACLALCS